MLKDAAIFDLDGVIVDTAKYHFLAWQRLAGELGFVFTKKDNEKLKGVSRMRSLELLLEVGGLSGRFSEEEMRKLAERKNLWYVEYISKMDENEILEGTIPCLNEFRRNGVKIVLGSASKNAMLILEKLKLLPYFDAIVDGTKVSRAKPHPEVFLTGAQEVGTSPEACVVFEDAQAGIEAAKKAGMKVVAVGSSCNLKEYDMIISGLYEANVKEIMNL